MSFTAEVKCQLAEVRCRSQRVAAAEFCAINMMTLGILRTSMREVAVRCEHLGRAAGGYIERVAYRRSRAGQTQAGQVRAQYIVGTRWSGHVALETEEEASSFIRGCFLVGGYITEPSKPAHLEISFRDTEQYEMCMAAFEMSGVVVKGTIRDDKYVLYIKDSEETAAFLTRTGAVKARLEYENARILKQCSKDSNRVTNCDDANISKSIEAGLRMKHMIEQFMGYASFRELPQQLIETAELRAANPDMSLAELGALMTPRLSKAGVAHRLKKLESVMAQYGIEG